MVNFGGSEYIGFCCESPCMRILQLWILLVLACLTGCDQALPGFEELDDTRVCACPLPEDGKPPRHGTHQGLTQVSGALLATRFASLDELKEVISIEYYNGKAKTKEAVEGNFIVRLSHCSKGQKVVSVLKEGISQSEIFNVTKGGILDAVGLAAVSPFSVKNRRNLERVFLLSRWKPDWFGERDIAFFDLAEKMLENINTPEIAFKHARDTTEKGYINSFNHITAQAFITSFASEEMADFVADVHERANMPELISGLFTPEQMAHPDDNPVDNYVDMINNEWGQELGKKLGEKYQLNWDTHWTPELLANYLNDMQSYFSWAFQIGFEPVRATDEVVFKFAKKINLLLRKHLPD